MQENQATETMQELRNLLAANPSLPVSTDPYQNSSWTPEDIAKARASAILRATKNGWKFDGGMLVKGTVKARPSTLMSLGHVGERGFNPRTDAFALRLGAEFIEEGPWAGRYRMGGHILNALGQFLDPEACPICGSVHGESRFKVRAPNPNPYAPAWQQVFTYCQRCCTPEEIEHLKSAPAGKGGRK